MARKYNKSHQSFFCCQGRLAHLVSGGTALTPKLAACTLLALLFEKQKAGLAGS
jgi:hypothetical protein